MSFRKLIIMLAVGANLIGAAPLFAQRPITRDIEAILQLGKHERGFGVRLELSFIDRAILFNRPLSLDAVEWDYTTKVCLGNESSLKLIGEFVELIRSADLRETEEEAEWRLSFIVRGTWNRRYLVMYADAQKRLIKIDGKRYLVTKEIASWIDHWLWAIEDSVKSATMAKTLDETAAKPTG